MLLEGQIVGKAGGSPDRPAAGASTDVGGLGLPTSGPAIVSYLTNSYGGVGARTAESLVEAFGADVFLVFETEPGRVAEIVPRRAPQVLAEWRADFERRSAKSRNQEEVPSEPETNVEPVLVKEPVGRTPGPGVEDVSPPSFPSSSAAIDDASSLAPAPDASSLAPAPDSSSSSAPAPRSGGARRRTRRTPRRPPSSGSDA